MHKTACRLIRQKRAGDYSDGVWLTRLEALADGSGAHPTAHVVGEAGGADPANSMDQLIHDPT